MCLRTAAGRPVRAIGASAARPSNCRGACLLRDNCSARRSTRPAGVKVDCKSTTTLTRAIPPSTKQRTSTPPIAKLCKRLPFPSGPLGGHSIRSYRARKRGGSNKATRRQRASQFWRRKEQQRQAAAHQKPAPGLRNTESGPKLFALERFCLFVCLIFARPHSGFLSGCRAVAHARQQLDRSRCRRRRRQSSLEAAWAFRANLPAFERVFGAASPPRTHSRQQALEAPVARPIWSGVRARLAAGLSQLFPEAIWSLRRESGTRRIRNSKTGMIDQTRRRRA